MPSADFFITSDRHHVAAALPVMERLAASGYRLRVISLCEVRGLTTPNAPFEPLGSEVLRVLPLNPRPSPASGRQRRGSAAGALTGTARRAARTLAWHLVLGPRLRRCLRRAGEVAVLPNDAAYPYDRIAALLGRRRIPFVLLQEGIRFPLVGTPDRYGTGGAAAIAAWGEASAEHFRGQGVDPTTVHLTGSPRLDVILSRDWEPEARRLRQEHDLGETNLLLASNPIDDQGFVDTAGKLQLVRRFVDGLKPLLAEPGFRLVVKLHSRESPEDFRAALAEVAGSQRIRILSGVPLYPLLASVDAAVVLASTVGLEALCFGVPLAVLEIPGAGFVYDYVDSGAARGLCLDRPMEPQMRELLSSGPAAGAEAFLERNLRFRTNAAQRVAELVDRVAGGRT